MKIALFGYGKMGKEIEQIAIERGHQIVLKIDVNNINTFSNEDLGLADAVIEFTTPESAVNNIYKCFDAKVPVVVGTTGWYQHFDEVKKRCEKDAQTLFYASNFSLGVNIFFKLNEYLASIMKSHPSYDITMEETHHVHKKDSPSGTAISLAEQIMERIDRKKKWVNDYTENPDEIQLLSHRIEEVPGTHVVNYFSTVDEIEIMHKAHSRKGFALGAVLAAEFIKDKKGIYNMNDLLKI